MFFKLKNIKKFNLVKFLRLNKAERQLIILVSLAIFVVFNFLLSPVSWRLDLSNGKAYTLSPSTKNILRNLDDIINIKFFVSSDLPTRFLPLKSDVIDFLNEYKNQSESKVVVKILDPKKDEQALNQAKEAGIPELQFSQIEQDKYAVSAVYFGIAVAYGEKKEIIPQATDLESLEYNLTAAIYKLTKKNLDKIAIVGKQESFDPAQDDLATLKKVLRQQFSLSFLDISSESNVKKIDSTYKSVLIFDDNKKEFSSDEINEIRDYLNNKGTAVFFIDGVWVLDNLQTAEAKNNLFGLLRDWGVDVNKNLVLSGSAEMVNFGNNQVQFFSVYPFWIKTDQFNQKLGFFSNINQLTFPWVSSLGLISRNNIETTELVKSTQKSWTQDGSSTGGFVLDPQKIPQPNAETLKEFVVVAQAKSKQGGQVIVIPSSRFIQERYLSRSSSNLEFVLNILDNLASGGALSGIRQRAVNLYPLPELSERQKDIFKYLNILLLPGFFALFGLVKLTKRR